MQSITVHSPCKINLSLDIVRRLPNGYHEMDMVMQTVDLCDTLTVSLHSGSDIQMTCTGPDSKPLPLACDDSNIAVRCTRAFFEHCGFSALPCSVVIHLVKRIPMMAGLGGGSALFGLFDNEAAACAARSALQDHPLLEGVFLCRPLPFGAFEAVRNSLRNPS